MHFPRTQEQEITCTAGTYQYDLAADFIDVLSVEYPDGEDPREYLKRRQHLHPEFWQADGYYDLIGLDDDTDLNQVWISENPTTGKKIIFLYQGYHDYTILTSANLTVRERHHHILRNYVMWRAVLQLKNAEEQSPTSNSSLLMSQYAVNTDRARRAYVDALAKAVFAETKSGMASWAGQAKEATRIY
jgi:hypothetical protein